MGSSPTPATKKKGYIMDINLAEKFIEKVKDGTAVNMTWDEFFNEFNVSVSDRSNFVVASILKQAGEVIDLK